MAQQSGQDMDWRAEKAAQIEAQVVARNTRQQCGGDCGDCNDGEPTEQCARAGFAVDG